MSNTAEALNFVQTDISSYFSKDSYDCCLIQYYKYNGFCFYDLNCVYVEDDNLIYVENCWNVVIMQPSRK